jgi:hypothetical protein
MLPFVSGFSTGNRNHRSEKGGMIARDPSSTSFSVDGKL